MNSIIIFDKEIYINEYPVLRINYDIDIRKIENSLLTTSYGAGLV